MPSVVTYVDAFNLYRGLKRYAAHEKARGWKWLDLDQISRRLVPGADVAAIHYFTAHLVTIEGGDESQRGRQSVYLRALRTFDHTTVHLGQYKARKQRYPLRFTPDDEGVEMLRAAGQQPRRVSTGHVTVDVWKMEEKGSDVNLATQLLADAFYREVEHAVVISNDTDLCSPIQLVRSRLGIPVTVVCPEGHKSTAYDLRKAATQVRKLRMNVVQASQLPTLLFDATGKIEKPQTW